MIYLSCQGQPAGINFPQLRICRVSVICPGFLRNICVYSHVFDLFILPLSILLGTKVKILILIVQILRCYMPH